jgi:hypothetical protein
LYPGRVAPSRRRYYPLMPPNIEIAGRKMTAA